MTQKTLSKRLRAIKVIVGETKRTKRYKIVGYEPADQKEEKIIEYRGEKMKVLLSKGQVINPRKEYERRHKKV